MVERGFKLIEYENRLERVQSMMSCYNIDILLITSEFFMRYFTGFSTQFWQSPTRPWFLIIPLKGFPKAVIPEIGFNAMQKTWIKEIFTWPSPRPEDEGISLILNLIKEMPSKFNNIGAELGREMFIFDIYREPLERKMSEFFGKLASFHFNADISVIEGYCVERLSKRFNSLFPYIGEEDHFLEIYDGVKKNPPVSFDHNNKLLHIQDKAIHYIKLRLRDYDKWDEILGPILDIDIVKIIDNTRDTLPLNMLYKKFKKDYLDLGTRNK